MPQIYVHLPQHHQAPPDIRSISLSDIRLLHSSDANEAHEYTAQHQPHHHHLFHIVVVIAGAGTFFHHQPIVCSAPWLFLIAPHELHSFQRLSKDDTVYAEVTFDLPTRRDITSWNDLLGAWCGARCSVHDGAIDPVLAQELATRMATCTTLGIEADGDLSSHFTALIAECFGLILRHCGQQDSDTDPLARAHRHLERHLGQQPDLQQLAKIAGYSHQHFGRAFKSRYGLAPIQYRRKRAMQRAATLLTATDRSIPAIAALLGFTDEHYFNRVFKQVIGESPGRYRRQHRAG